MRHNVLTSRKAEAEGLGSVRLGQHHCWCAVHHLSSRPGLIPGRNNRQTAPLMHQEESDGTDALLQGLRPWQLQSMAVAKVYPSHQLECQQVSQCPESVCVLLVEDVDQRLQLVTQGLQGCRLSIGDVVHHAAQENSAAPAVANTR